MKNVTILFFAILANSSLHADDSYDELLWQKNLITGGSWLPQIKLVTAYQGMKSQLSLNSFLGRMEFTRCIHPILRRIRAGRRLLICDAVRRRYPVIHPSATEDYLSEKVLV